MSAVVTLDFEGWLPALTEDARQRMSRALEEGSVLRLPRVSFVLTEAERRFLSASWSDRRAKNISLDGERLKGATGSAADAALRVTKGRRSVYDHVMLNLHNRAKADLAYQRDACRRRCASRRERRGSASRIR